MHKPGRMRITTAVCRQSVLTRMLFYRHYRWLAWPKVPLLLQQLGSWVQDRIVTVDATWRNLEMQTADTSHVCLDDLTMSTQSLLVPELHILGPYIQCLVKNPMYMSKKLIHIRHFKYSHWDLQCVFNLSHLKRKETTSFHLLKASPFKIKYFCGLNLGHDLIPTENNYLSKSYFTTMQFNDSTETVTLLSSIYSIIARCKVQIKKNHHLMAILSNIFTSITKITVRLLLSSSSPSLLL